MSDVAIRVEGLSKLYKIGKLQRHDTLRDRIADARLFNLFKRRNGNPNANSKFAIRNSQFRARFGNITYMSKALEEITKQATELPRQQRLALANFLLELDDYGDGPDVEAAWEQEILARIHAVDDGTAVGIAYEDVMREAQDRLAT